MTKSVSQTMELSQATQTIQWLDEERRKDKARIAKLEEQSRAQGEQIAQQSALIQELQTTLAGVQESILRVSEFEKTVSNYKDELVYLLDEREEQWKKERAEANRLHKIEMESVTDQLAELTRQFKALPNLEERFQSFRTEDQRLNEVLQRLQSQVTQLSNRTDDRVQAVTYLEEQRRTDNRRIAELEQEAADLRQKYEAASAKLALLETAIQKQRTQIAEAAKPIREFEKTINEVKAAEFRREQAVKKYMDQAEQVRDEMEKLRQQTQGYVEQRQQNKRALEKLEEFRARIDKRQNEVSEMQRLAEDRIKRQWEEWQAARAKDLKKRQMVVEERWKAQEKTNQAQTDRIEQLQSRVNIHFDRIEALFEFRRSEAHEQLRMMQDAVEREEERFSQARADLRGEE